MAIKTGECQYCGITRNHAILRTHEARCEEAQSPEHMARVYAWVEYLKPLVDRGSRLG